MSDQTIENKLRDEISARKQALSNHDICTALIALSLDRIASLMERQDRRFMENVAQYSPGNRAMTAEEVKEMFGFDPLECGQEYDAERASVDESDKQDV